MWYKNERIIKNFDYFVVHFQNLIVMSLHEAFRVWTDHYKSRMSNVGQGEAEAYIAYPRLVMVRPYEENFMQWHYN